ncbi:hypothetical protein SOVF_194740 isoform A, partial [Spinacia oleracea]
ASTLLFIAVAPPPSSLLPFFFDLLVNASIQLLVIKEAWLDGKHRFWLFSRGLFDLKGRNLQRSDLIELN